MSKRVEVKALKEHAFAQAYVDNGFNGKQAMLAINSEMTDNSAAVEGSKLLKNPNVQERIEALTSGVREDLSRAIGKAVRKFEREIDDPDPDKSKFAAKMLADYGKIYQPEQKQPKTAIQNNKYYLPERK